MTENLPEFMEFPKMFRLFRDIVITEKIDGTNAQILVQEDGTVLAGSRTRWITPENDNFGFAAWVRDHADELRGLGIGRHFGEWWGRGIQKGYGLDHRRFSLFNVSRWADDSVRPACCHVVPTLYTGPFSEDIIVETANTLHSQGSVASPGFMAPEGIVVFHVQSMHLYKYTPHHGNDGHKNHAYDKRPIGSGGSL